MLMKRTGLKTVMTEAFCLSLEQQWQWWCELHHPKQLTPKGLTGFMASSALFCWISVHGGCSWASSAVSGCRATEQVLVTQGTSPYWHFCSCAIAKHFLEAEEWGGSSASVACLVPTHRQAHCFLLVTAGCAEPEGFSLPCLFMLTSVCWTSKGNLSKPESCMT